MKKDLIPWIAIIGLTAAFLVVSAVVYFTGTRSPRAVRWKLKLGALLLTFNAMLFGASAREEVVSCYLMPREPHRKFYLGGHFGASFKQDTEWYNIINDVTDSLHYWKIPVSWYNFGITALYEIGDPAYGHHWIKADMKYSRIHGNQTDDISNHPLLPEKVKRSAKDIDFRFDRNISFHVIQMNVGYYFSNIFSLPFLAGVDLTYSYVIEGNYKESLEILNDDPDIIFIENLPVEEYSDDNRKVIVYEGEPINGSDNNNTSSSNLGTDFYIGYEIDLKIDFDHRAKAQAIIGYHYDLKYISDRLWVHGFFIEGNIVFEL